MKNLRLLGAVCTATLFVLTANAKASTLWDQPLDPSLSGVFSNFVLGSSMNLQIAENFTLTEPSTIDSISWAGYYVAPQMLIDPVSFKIRFFEDAGVTPETPIDSFFQEYDVHVNAVATGDIGVISGDGGPVFSYAVSLPSLMLDPGTYWVSITEADTRTPASGFSQWLWSRSDFSGNFAGRRGDLEIWSSAGDNTSGDLAMTLTGTVVPIPAAVWLFGSGLLGLVGIARRKKTV